MKGARPISTAEVFRLLYGSRDDPRLHALVAVLAYTGCRLSEALSLTWEQVLSRRRPGEVADVLRFPARSTKGASPGRLVPLGAAPKRALGELRELAPLACIGGRPVFSSRGARPWSRSQATRSLRALIDRELGEAGAAVSSHSLRKWFASTLREQGRDLAQIAELLGHADIRTTRIYLAVPSPDELAGAVDALPVPHDPLEDSGAA